MPRDTARKTAKLVLESKNVIISSPASVGIVGKVLEAIEGQSLKVVHLDLATPAGIYFGSDSLVGAEIWMKISKDFLDADVIVLSSAERLTKYSAAVVEKLLRDKRVYGTWLPKLKSVVAIFYGDPSDNAPQLTGVFNTQRLKVYN